MALEDVYQKSPDLKERQILGENLLVPIRGQLADLQQLIALNSVANHIWGLLDGEHDLNAIQESLAENFEVDPEQAQADLEDFISQLKEAGLIIEVV